MLNDKIVAVTLGIVFSVGVVAIPADVGADAGPQSDSVFAPSPALAPAVEFLVGCDACDCGFEASALAVGHGRLWTVGKGDRLFHVGLETLGRAVTERRGRIDFEATPLSFAASVEEKPVHDCGGGWESLSFGHVEGRSTLFLSHEAPSRRGPACLAPARCEAHRVFAATVGSDEAPLFESLVEHVDLAPYSGRDRCNSSWEASQWFDGRGLLLVAEASASVPRAILLPAKQGPVRPVEFAEHRLRVSAAVAVPHATDELILASYCWHGDRIGCAKDAERSALTVSRWRLEGDRLRGLGAARLLADARTFNAEGAAVVEIEKTRYLALINDNHPSDDDCSPTRLRLYDFDSLFEDTEP